MGEPKRSWCIRETHCEDAGCPTLFSRGPWTPRRGGKGYLEADGAPSGRGWGHLLTQGSAWDKPGGTGSHRAHHYSLGMLLLWGGRRRLSRRLTRSQETKITGKAESDWGKAHCVEAAS